jgi:hypothetical protein
MTVPKNSLMTQNHRATADRIEPNYLYSRFEIEYTFAQKDARSDRQCDQDGEVLFNNIHAATLSVFGALSCDVPSQLRTIIRAAVPRHNESPPI